MVKIFKSMRKQGGRGTVFSDPGKLNLLLELRKKGYPYTEIAKTLGVDHTTVIYHCRKAGLVASKIEKYEIFDLLDRGKTTEEIENMTGIRRTVIELCKTLYKLQGEKLFARKVELPPLPMGDVFEYEYELAPKLRKRLIRTDERGVEWRKDERGEWVCLGKSETLRKKEMIDRKKIALEQCRLNMLKY